jgi:hypothetical protein
MHGELKDKSITIYRLKNFATALIKQNKNKNDSVEYYVGFLAHILFND